MKKFTKFITLVFAFTMLINFSLNAQHYPNVNGNTNLPQMQILIYGTTLPVGDSLVPGDEVAIYDGGTMVGRLTLSVTPSLTNFASCQLDAFTFNTSGDPLYNPGNPLLLKCWDASEGLEYITYGSTEIIFHGDWYAPTTTPYFPAEGIYSYCYVDLTFSTLAPEPYNATLVVTVMDNASVPVTTANVFTGDYDGVEPGVPDGTYTLDLFTGTAGDDVDYTITINHSSYTNETFDITVNAAGSPYAQTVILDAFGNLDGDVTYLDPSDLLNQIPVENALVSVTIDGTIYSDATDAAGDYLVEDIPDGILTLFSVSYPQYITQTFTETITHGVTTTHAATIELLPQKGALEGEIYNAITMELIKDPNPASPSVTINLYEYNSATWLHKVETDDGTYNLSYYGGTYDIVVSSVGYDDFTIDNHVFYPGVTVDLNFSLLPINTDANFDPITGNPNQMWSIHIQNAFFGINNLLPFDELVIFDIDVAGLAGEPGLRVGTLRLSNTTSPQNAGSNVLKAYAEFSNGDPGFSINHELEIWAYDISHGAVYETPLDFAFYEGWGTFSGPDFPDPSGNHVSYCAIYWSTIPGQLNGTVTDVNGPLVGVNVEAINIYTQLVVETTTTVAGGLYSMSLDGDIYDVRFSLANYTTVVEEDALIVTGATTTVDTELTARVNATIDYDFSTQGYYFIGRCVEQATVDMLDLLDNNGNPNLFSTNYLSSWVENDAANRLVYNSGLTQWETLPYNWDLLEGYQLYLDDVAGYEFDMTGYMVEPEDNPIVFAAAGIYYVPYFPYDKDAPDNAITAFASILDNLDWVLDSEGNRLFKNEGMWVDNIGDLSLGEGFKVLMNDAATLTYPASGAKSAIYKSTMMDPVHFVYNGGNAAEWTYTIYIETEDFEIGDEIAAFSNGVMVGSMVIDSDDPWQNDLNTFNVAVNGGYGVNVPIELIAWDFSENQEYNIEFEMININSQCYAGENFPAGLDHFSYSIISRGEPVYIAENQIDSSVKIYPNPVNRTLNIESVNNINMIYIYNIYGSIVSKINVNTKHQQIDVSNFRTGTYMIQLHTDNGVITNRVVIQ